VLLSASSASAAILRVCASGCAFSDLQAAIDAAQPGDTILLRAGETFVGPFVLRAKPVSSQWIEIRSDASDSLLPAEGVRLVPSGKPGANTNRSLLPRLIGRGSNYRTTPVVHTEPGANHYVLRFLEIDGSASLGWETLIALGDDTTAPTATDIVIDRVYAHGHFEKGQKRGIALNSGRTDILNSYISDIRAVGFDSQAIGGYNGTGPYRIINNYLEAAGENIMFGGDDPAVYNLVPSNIEIRRNHIYKPTSWAGPILSTPVSVRALDSGTGGALQAGTHYFKVVALMDTGPVVAQSLPSQDAAVTVPGSRTATITWPAVARADRYRIYRGWGPGAQYVYMETSSNATTFQYTGVGEQSGTPPTSASQWAIKNLVELKNAENVLFDGNVIENIWPAAQNGYAIMLTPRNQYGGAPWTRVRDVTFTNNIIRNATGVLSLTGYDTNNTSQQTQRITFRNNLIYDIDANGGWNKTFVMGEQPATVTIDHNTIVHTDTAVVFPYGGQIPGFSFTNNVTLHNQYGIMGDGGQVGTYSINMYFPGGVVTNNVLAGGNAALYPSPNSFPTLSEWNASFADLANDDYRILSSSPFYAAGAGGTVPGANLGQLYDATQPSGSVGTPSPDPAPTDPPSSPNTAPVARAGGPYTTTVNTPFQVSGTSSSDAEGAIASYFWRFNDDIVIHASDLPTSSIVGSAWTRSAVAGAADGVAMLNADRGAAKLSTPLASPASYVEFRFHAASGVPYRIWVRSRAQNDSWANDSMFMQFSGRVDAQGRALHRVGTTDAAVIFLEEGNGNGVLGWGWNDEEYGSVAGPVYFASSGQQTIRIQQREDGIAWDQIVISADTYRSSAPGALKGDTTLVPKTLGTSASAVSTYEYSQPGQYPLVLTVTDGGGLSATATTTVTVSTSGTGGSTPTDLQANHGGPYTGTVGTAVTFDGSRSTSSSTTQFFWTFGDDIVLGAQDFGIVGSRWRIVPDSSAANGSALENPDLGEGKASAPSASSYVEATFRAAAGVPYRIWFRMRAANDSWTNDSVFVQFSGSLTASGAAVNRIGTAQGMVMFLEDGNSAGLAGWGWGDNGYGTSDTPVYFNNDGVQRIRIAQREDGLRIDQIVISAGTYGDRAPGAEKNDTIIVPAYPSSARGSVVSHVYRRAGVFPVALILSDGSGSAIGPTTATIR
jgi:hypothetical protein